MQFASTLRFTFFTLYIAPVTVMEVSRSEILLSRDEIFFPREETKIGSRGREKVMSGKT